MFKLVTLVTSGSVALALVACRGNPDYCADEPNHYCHDAGSDVGSCTSNDQCSAPTAVCDLAGSMTCVQCVAPDQVIACSGTTPACGSDHACRACKAHSECASNACLPDGSCGSDSNVAYVDPAGTDNTTCTKAMPCTSVAKALATNRPYVKFHGTSDEAVALQGGRSVTFLADPGAVLTRSSGTGPILTVQDDNTSLTVFDLSISNAPNNASGRGILVQAIGAPSVTLTRAIVSNNPGGAISTGGGSLTVARSTISGNGGGGISMSGGTFVIVGNVFFNNGTPTGTVGGISITTTQNAANRLEFNSFNTNQAQVTIGAAIQCTAGAFTARNNIMSGNGTLTNMEQVGGGCAHAYSIVRPGTLPSGTGNSAADPLFVNTTTGDLHIMSGSPARDVADPNADLTGIAAYDIDGDSRTAPADIGADQVP